LIGGIFGAKKKEEKSEKNKTLSFHFPQTYILPYLRSTQFLLFPVYFTVKVIIYYKVLLIVTPTKL